MVKTGFHIQQFRNHICVYQKEIHITDFAGYSKSDMTIIKDRETTLLEPSKMPKTYHVKKWRQLLPDRVPDRVPRSDMLFLPEIASQSVTNLSISRDSATNSDEDSLARKPSC